MKIPLKHFILGAVMMFAAVAVASATTYQFGSYASTGPTFGNQNSGMVFLPGISQTGPGIPTTNDTVPIPANAPWSNALTATSTWISYGNTAPGDVPFAPNGSYFFATSFILDSDATSFSISLLADDTVSVFLDSAGGPLLRQRSVGANVTCQTTQPNCTDPLTVDLPPNLLSLLTGGPHTLVFEVFQTNSQAMGLDWTATATTANSPVPEPSSLLLLGTGLIGTAGTLLRRMRA